MISWRKIHPEYLVRVILIQITIVHSESNQNTVISAPIKGYPSLQETMKIPTCKGSTLSLKCPISTHATVDQLSLNIKKIHSFPPQIKTTRLSQRDRRQAASTTTPTTPTSSSSSSLLSIVSSTSQDLILKDSKKWSLQPRQTPRMNSFIDIQNEQTIYTKQSNFQNSKISSITNTTP